MCESRNNDGAKSLAPPGILGDASPVTSRLLTATHLLGLG